MPTDHVVVYAPGRKAVPVFRSPSARNAIWYEENAALVVPGTIIGDPLLHATCKELQVDYSSLNRISLRNLLASTGYTLLGVDVHNLIRSN